MQEIQQLLHESDSYAAAEHIQRSGTPLEIAERYAALVLDLYWKAHDLPAVIAIGRAGILYCLSQSAAADLSAETIEKLRSTAKGLAYNVGSFTWPGWDDPNIHPTPHQAAVGRDCAALNLRLARELHKPPKALANAHWLVAAHALAALDFAIAQHEFQTAHDVLSGADPANPLNLCNLGYVAITKLCANPADVPAARQLDEILTTLHTRNDEDGAAYAAQLVAAQKVFVPPAAR